MADELIDICDENNNLLGIRKMKSEAHRTGRGHRAAHVWVYNSKGEILLQLRAKTKELFPNMWDVSAAGHVSAGEEPIDSAVRETKEEIGLSVKKEDLEFFRIAKLPTIFRHIKNNEFYYDYLLKFDGNITDLKIQKEEVDAIKFVPIVEIEKGLKEFPERYVPHGNDHWFDVISEIKCKLEF